jgi:hypothetical protein
MKKEANTSSRFHLFAIPPPTLTPAFSWYLYLIYDYRLKLLSESLTFQCHQRWNSWTVFLVEVSGHKLETSQTRVFVWFSTLLSPFYKMLTMKRFEFSCIVDFFVRIIKTIDENVPISTVTLAKKDAQIHRISKTYVPVPYFTHR